MKYLLALFVSVAQAQTVIQTTPVYLQTGKENYLMGDIITDAAAPGVPTHCSGWLHEGVYSNTPYTIPDTPVQTTQPKCKITITGKLKVGTMTWYACSSDHGQPIGGGSSYVTACNPVPVQFTVVQGTAPTPLGAPTNLKKGP